MELKTKLVQLRKQKSLTQMELAEKLDISRQAISRWESGIAVPSMENLRCLSRLYGVPIEYLLNDEIETPSQPEEIEKKEPQLRSLESKRTILGIVVICIAAVVLLFLYKAYSMNDSEKSPISVMESEAWDDTGAKDFALDW